jgi:hypothetical protein
MATRKELKAAIGERYRAAVGRERRQILEEFARVTAYHRKHALKVFNRTPLSASSRSRHRLYDEAVLQALKVVWEAANRICGKRSKRRYFRCWLRRWNGADICNSTPRSKAGF